MFFNPTIPEKDFFAQKLQQFIERLSSVGELGFITRKTSSPIDLAN